jgi:hypothetical protein
LNVPDAVDVLLKSERNAKFRIRDERRTKDPRVVKTENSRGVIAEFDEGGHVIRTYLEKRERPLEKLYDAEPPSTGYVTEAVAQLLGVGDLEESLRK